MVVPRNGGLILHPKGGLFIGVWFIARCRVSIVKHSLGRSELRFLVLQVVTVL